MISSNVGHSCRFLAASVTPTVMVWIVLQVAASARFLVTFGILLLLNVWTEIGSLGSAVLLATFSAAGIVALLRQLEIRCGCFGDLSAKISWGHILLNAFLIAACLFVTFAENFRESRKRVQVPC